MNIQTVFFDMGGTIETYWYTQEMRLQGTHRLDSLLKSFGIHLNLSTTDLFHTITAGLKEYHDAAVASERELPAVEVWKKFILPAYPQYFPQLDLHGEELMYWLDTNFYHRALRPEVPAALEALKNMGLQIGLISNICSLNQVPENLKAYGIAGYFSVVVTSSQYGRRKPDPSIIRHAAFLAGVPTSKCAYIGDRVVRDIDGARRAGFGLAVQIMHDFDHGESDEGARPDAVIHEMSALVQIIAAENAKCDDRPARHNRIQALLFDAGDILYFRPKRGEALKQFLKEIAPDLSPDSGEAVRTEIKLRGYSGEISRDAYFSEMIQSYGVRSPDQIERGKRILSDADDSIQFFEDVCITLKKLKAMGFMLGIITDTAVPAYVKMRWFENGGFGDVWDAYISSREFGYQKPDPRIYQAALDQLGVSAGQSVFVGHSPEELVGANALGMHTIGFNLDTGAQAEHIAEKFGDIVRIIEQYRLDQDAVECRTH